jgi:AraC family ethanolamine operon transcriptional activator
MDGPLADPAYALQNLQTFDSLESFSSAARTTGLDVDFQQTRPGTAQVTVQTTLFDHLRISRFRINAPAIRRGAPRPGVVSFWLREDPQPTDGYWCGQSVEGMGVSVFPGEFYASGRTHLDGTVIEIDREHLTRLAELIEYDPCESDLRGPLALQLAPIQVAELAAHKNALVRGCSPANQAQRQLDLGLGLLRAIRQAPRCRARPRIATRRKAFAQARSYIDAYADEELTSADLCTAAGVSQRTLEYAFRDCCGLSPKAYLKIVRLNRTRATLRRAEPGGRVADAANQWGFWHMGQFARDYQDLFGVLPKADLLMAVR